MARVTSAWYPRGFQVVFDQHRENLWKLGSFLSEDHHPRQTEWPMKSRALINSNDSSLVDIKSPFLTPVLYIFNQPPS